MHKIDAVSREIIYKGLKVTCFRDEEALSIFLNEPLVVNWLSDQEVEADGLAAS